jgi:CsoR family transcriptional regulator, copper-sensing transcriptional repressor
MNRDNSILDARLASVEGHIRGIRKMLGDGVYCVDVIKQTFAVERALKRFEAELLRSHLSTCVPSGFSEGRSDVMVRELGDLFELARR